MRVSWGVNAKPPDQRAAFLYAVWAGRPQLRYAIGALVGAHDVTGGSPERPVADLDQTVSSHPGAADHAATGKHTPQPDDAFVRLTTMGHPNITRVLDGMLTAAGQHFFVMELVNGLPPTRFCNFR
jgi:hypothetical protein